MPWRGRDSALCCESEESPFLHLASASSPVFPPSSSILIMPQLAKSEPPSCEGLSLFFSQPPERQQAASKSVPRVTSVEEAERAGEEPRRRRLPCLAACQARNAIHSRGAGEHPPSAGRLHGPGFCSARGFISAWRGGEEPPGIEGGGGGGAVVSSIRPPLLHPEFEIISLSYLQVGLRVKHPSLSPPLTCWVSHRDRF